VIEKRKDPKQYRRALKLGAVTNRDNVLAFPRNGAEGAEVIFSLSSEPIADYLTALTMPDGDAKTWCLGKCFGYSDEDIAEFITNTPACDCSKCSAPPEKDGDARRTQYHAK
jgi:hypothetical protein